MNESLYSENDVAEIVRRAAEMQAEGGQEPYTPGVTGAELVRIAAEVGIAPEYIQRAAAEHREGRTSGKTLARRAERVLPVELRPEDYDAVFEVARPSSTAPLAQIGSSLQGHVRSGWGQSLLQITSRNGRTKLAVENEGGVAVAMAILWTVPLCLAPVLGALTLPLWGAAAALGCAAGAVGTYRALDRKARRDTHAMADALERTILERAASTSAPATQAAEEEGLRQNLTQS